MFVINSLPISAQPIQLPEVQEAAREREREREREVVMFILLVVFLSAIQGHIIMSFIFHLLLAACGYTLIYLLREVSFSCGSSIF